MKQGMKTRRLRVTSAGMYILFIVMCALLLSAYIWMWYEVKIENLESSINGLG